MNSVLYDAPGPRARRISVIASIASVVLIGLGLYYLVYRPLEANDQLTMERWGLLIDPSHPQFSGVWSLLLEGWLNTFAAAGLSIVLSIAAGIGIALLRAQLRGQKGRRFTDRAAGPSVLLRWTTGGGTGISRVWVEFFRGLPVVVTIFLVYKVFADFGLLFEDEMWYLVIGLTLYNSVVIGEILRSGMDGLPHGQREAASSLGLSVGQSIRMVQLPQALRIMLPALISQIVVIFKDTSLGTIVSFNEALRTSRNIIEAAGSSGIPTPTIPMYTITGVMYILICYALSKLAVYTERRMSRSGLPTPPTVMTQLDTGDAIGGAYAVRIDGEVDTDVPASARSRSSGTP
ncbi:amino acid ABC transporter permease [Allorhizocola rhizosphaerae]|uniref:amino acid ABC transporter permease n=1 Tax=Allorhizocola rhizosphaerae TaxID=1872709 RepID=UPI000E3C79F6|nr:amino acid ABC transporter permease [Allorhizocola rhizosphaerae]